MLMTRQTASKRSISYPESDGKPLAENTKQLRWIITLVDNLSALFHDRPDVFVAGDQLWYPVEGEKDICTAPDVYVVFGQAKGDRPCWKQWEEGGVPMTVVFEIISPSNSVDEMNAKFIFYEDYGVEEYYQYNPDTNVLLGFLRRGDILGRIRPINGFVSPRLGIRFDLSGPELVVRHPDGRPFLTFEELEAERAKAVQRAEQIERRATRQSELTRKALQGQATPEERQELQRLLEPPPATPG